MRELTSPLSNLETKLTGSGRRERAKSWQDTSITGFAVERTLVATLWGGEFREVTFYYSTSLATHSQATNYVPNLYIYEQNTYERCTPVHWTVTPKSRLPKYLRSVWMSRKNQKARTRPNFSPFMRCSLTRSSSRPKARVYPSVMPIPLTDASTIWAGSVGSKGAVVKCSSLKVGALSSVMGTERMGIMGVSDHAVKQKMETAHRGSQYSL